MDVLGDEVDSLVALLEKVHVVMDQYAPVLLHYPGVSFNPTFLPAFQVSNHFLLCVSICNCLVKMFTMVKGKLMREHDAGGRSCKVGGI